MSCFQEVILSLSSFAWKVRGATFRLPGLLDHLPLDLYHSCPIAPSTDRFSSSKGLTYFTASPPKIDKVPNVGHRVLDDVSQKLVPTVGERRTRIIVRSTTAEVKAT